MKGGLDQTLIMWLGNHFDDLLTTNMKPIQSLLLWTLSF
jgi:hypothetical protein